MGDWKIEVPQQASSSELTAAEELAHYLVRVALSLRVRGVGPITLHVGDTAFARGQGIQASSLAPESWRIKSFDRDMVLVGGGTRGTLYAAYHFLEDYIGVHWWNPSEEHIPTARDFDFEAFDESGHPFFTMREICRGIMFPDDGGRFSVRNRINRSGYDKLNDAYGGGCDFGPPFFVHTYDSYLPAAVWLEMHPEYFSLSNGVRIGGQSLGQLCLTHPDVLEIFWARLQEYIRDGEAEAVTRRVPPPIIYEISHNDNWRYCQCSQCQEIIDRDGHSGLMLRFVNPLADRLSAFRPGLFISVLAYYTTAEAPRNIVPRDNIIVRLCDTFSNCAASIHAPENATYRALIESWSRISSNLCIWDYSINYREECVTLPYPSEYHYSETHRFYADHGVRFLFWEHEWPDCSDMYDYKVHLEAKYLENPYRNDFEVLQNDFMEAYYGPAGPFILSYRERLRQAAVDHDAVLAGFGCSRIDFTFIDLDTLLACHRICDDAMVSVAGDELYRSRVIRARLGLDCLAGFSLSEYYLAQWAQRGQSVEEFPLDLEHLRARTLSTWRDALRDMPPNDMVESYIAQTIAMRQDSRGLDLSLASEEFGCRVQPISREMICCEGPGVFPGRTDDPYLVSISIMDWEAVSLISGVYCITQGNRETVRLEIPLDELLETGNIVTDVSFPYPGQGACWYLTKSVHDPIRPVTIRLDFLRRLGFSDKSDWTIRLKIRCEVRPNTEVGDVPKSSFIFIDAVSVMQ